MLTVSLCDILSVNSVDSQHKKVSSMPHQSSRIKATTLNETKQKGATRAIQKIDQVENKIKNGHDVKTFYSTKPSIDILSEVQNNSARKRKANFSKRAGHDSSEQDDTKQIKVEEVHKGGDDENEEVEEVHKGSDDENEEFEYIDPEDSFEGMSEYEKMRQKNIEEKMAFFASLNFEVARQDLLQASSAPKKKPPRVIIKKERPTTVRKSLRLQRISPEGQPMPALEAVVEPVTGPKPRKPLKPLAFQEVFLSLDQNSENLLKDMSRVSRAKLEFDSVNNDQYMSYFTTMKLKSVAKTIPSKIFSVAIHPSPNKTLICAGSIQGHVGFYDVGSKNSQGGIYVYEPHSRLVNCLAFNANKPHQIISVSYDGTARCGNLKSGIFDDIFHTSEEDCDNDIRATSFDFLSPESLIISLNTGKVVVTDMRTPCGQDEKMSSKLHTYPIKTVSVHPVKKDYFVTAARNGAVSLWDLRFLKKSSIADIVLPKCAQSAYFSPVTGNSLLTTSMDNRLCVFDTTQLKGPLELKKFIRHDNQTGRWLTPFRAVWLPNNEDMFVVGSMQQPRRIEVYKTSGNLAHIFADENLTSVCSINAFHPSRPVLAGGNASGKLHVFMGKE